MINVEIQEIKSDISNFMAELKKNLPAGSNLPEYQCNFLLFLAKQIIFIKNLYAFKSDAYHFSNDLFYLKVIISDLLYYSLSLVKNEIRYTYLNERSFIENYVRFLLNKDLKQSHVLLKDLESLPSIYSDVLSNDDYNLLMNEYKTCCSYIHSGISLKKHLSSFLSECTKNSQTIPKLSKYINRIHKLIYVFNKLIIFSYADFVNTAFFCKKDILQYLIGDDLVEFLFKHNKKISFVTTNSINNSLL